MGGVAGGRRGGGREGGEKEEERGGGRGGAGEICMGVSRRGEGPEGLMIVT